MLQAAIRLADQVGIESLTMRKLARALGVEAMSLYNHVANKDDLVDGVVDLVVGEIDLPSTDGPVFGNVLLMSATRQTPARLS